MVQLTKKGADFIWSEACTASFEEVKNILTTAPVMAYPRDEGGYILDTDACDVSIGAALSQIQDGQEKDAKELSNLCNCLRWWPLFNFQNIGRVRSNSLTRDNMSKESNFSL
jgi:hypothetical protein